MSKVKACGKYLGVHFTSGNDSWSTPLENKNN